MSELLISDCWHVQAEDVCYREQRGSSQLTCLQSVVPGWAACHGCCALVQAKKPVLYVGGGCLNSWRELREFVSLTGIPVAQTLMGLGTFDATDPLSLHVSTSLSIHQTAPSSPPFIPARLESILHKALRHMYVSPSRRAFTCYMLGSPD